MVLWRHTKPSRTNINQKCPFHHRGLGCKSRKSRDTWSNRQIGPWSTKWSRAKAKSFARECTGHSKHPFSTTQDKTLHIDITRWSIPKSDWLYSLQPKMKKRYQFSSVAQSCRTHCDPMNCSTPGLPVHYWLLEYTQTHVHWGDAIQPSHLLSSPSLPAFNLSQHQGLFQWLSSSLQLAKVLEFQPRHQSFQWTPRTDFL